MELFNGIEFAKQRELILKKRVSQLQSNGIKPSIVSIVFTEDAGSQLYTQKKLEAAKRVGINFQPIFFSLQTTPTLIINKIKDLNADGSIAGVMIQKPAQWVWLDKMRAGDFAQWWRMLVSEIEPNKDVDGLTPKTQQAIKDGSWQAKQLVLPATAQANLLVLDQAGVLGAAAVAVIGRSDIVGLPTFYALKQLGFQSTLLGQSELAERVNADQNLNEFDVVISATGVKHLITGKMVKPGVVLIDVGEPQPDIDAQSVSQKASFLSPVPGGVGPVTVTCLLENLVSLASQLEVVL